MAPTLARVLPRRRSTTAFRSRRRQTVRAAACQRGPAAAPPAAAAAPVGAPAKPAEAAAAAGPIPSLRRASIAPFTPGPLLEATLHPAAAAAAPAVPCWCQAQPAASRALELTQTSCHRRNLVHLTAVAMSDAGRVSVT